MTPAGGTCGTSFDPEFQEAVLGILDELATSRKAPSW